MSSLDDVLRAADVEEGWYQKVVRSERTLQHPRIHDCFLCGALL